MNPVEWLLFAAAYDIVYMSGTLRWSHRPADIMLAAVEIIIIWDNLA